MYIFIFNETNSVTTGHVNPGPSFNEKATVYIYSQICPRQCEKSPLHICMYVCMYGRRERRWKLQGGQVLLYLGGEFGRETLGI
jgi:hypothetical protein